MSSQSNGKYVYWLLPEEKATAYFQSVINKLARKHNTTAFLPHITIARPPQVSVHQLTAHLKSIANQNKPYWIKVKKVWCKKPWNEKISVEIDLLPNLKKLITNIDKELGGDYSTKQYLHLSLLYGQMSCKSLRIDVQQLNHAVINRFRVTKMALVHIFGEPNEWEIVEEREL